MSAGRTLGALLSGALFGAGLSLSGMANPAKVLGFLNLSGSWDPSLALVMAGALIPAALAFNLTRANGKIVFRPAPLADRRITKSLILGAVLFGIGWGLAGFCPGPAIVALGFAQPKALIFTLAMFGGFVLHALLVPPVIAAPPSDNDAKS